MKYKDSIIIVTESYQPTETYTQSTTDVTNTSGNERFSIPLKSGGYLECLKTSSINCVTPTSRNIMRCSKRSFLNQLSTNTIIPISFCIIVQ